VSWSRRTIIATLPTAKPEGIYYLSVTVRGRTISVALEILDMVWVPAGEFPMGSGGPAEQPVHTVYLGDYWIDRTEVTVDAYAACLAKGGCAEPNGEYIPGRSALCNWKSPRRGDNPINCIDWSKSQQYCSWRRKRLPTEAEWEKAARGPAALTYPWGEATPSCQYAVMWDPASGADGCGLDSTWTVGLKPDGGSIYGALDMAGNVWEWVHDWYSATYYSVSPHASPWGPTTGDYKVYRGGCFENHPDGINYLSSWLRGTSLTPSNWADNLGFRCVRDPG
jgi:formylglycine-generating enzyme required for sulfatase activity